MNATKKKEHYISNFSGPEVDAKLEAVDSKQEILKPGKNIKTINGESLLGEGDLRINAGIDPELLEGFIPLSRDFSDDFNNDFAR
jgi:hypothetical protein